MMTTEEMDSKNETTLNGDFSVLVILTSNNSGQEQTMEFNGSYSVLDEHPYIPIYLYVLVTLFNVCIFVFGMIGNILVVLVIVKARNMRTPTNYFLFSLSIADIMVLLFCQPAALTEFYSKDRWFMGRAMCKYNVSMF